MATLAVVPSLPVHFTAPDKVLLTHKFVEGMKQYARLWDGSVVTVMHPHTEMSTGNLDDAVFPVDQLPFEVRSAQFGAETLHVALADADVVMLGGDDRLNNLSRWCHDNGKKTVYVTEYSLRTRLQIVNAEQRNPLIKLRKYLWEWQQEQYNKRAIAAADAVQCNGTPTYDSYRQLNDNALLFFDSRVTAGMLADPDAMAARRARLTSESPLRLAFSGRLNSMKGADHVIDVARHLHDAGLSFRLDIFGDGPLRPAMQQQIKHFNLEQAVRLHGVVDYATELLPHVKNSIDLFICCHRQGDPSCTYIETLACGVPIAGYANEAWSGMLENCSAGWSTPLDKPELLAQQVLTLSAQPEQIYTAGEAALNFARKHTFEEEFGARIRQIASLVKDADAPALSAEGATQSPAVPVVRLPLTELSAERLQIFLRRKRAETLRAQAMRETFSASSQQRLLLVSQSERIPQSQIYPFHRFAKGLQDAYDVSIREASLQDILQGHPIPQQDATVIAFQTPYDISDTELLRLLDGLRSNSPGARLVYLDWSAPADLRNAERLDPHIQLYVKKHVLRDRSQYGQPTLGDTNLADHYARRLGLAEQEYCFAIPDGFMDKLIVGPSFATAPLILPGLEQPFNSGQDRTIDLHARFAISGTDWYQAMRGEAAEALKQVDDLKVATGDNLPLYSFISELRRSRVCFSPFGYGEVCWRDYEAVMAGAVLLKPDTSHIETNPDIFRAWETYVPVRWDLSDFDATLRRVLEDKELRLSIARNAHNTLQNYLCKNGFVEQMRPLFSDD